MDDGSALEDVLFFSPQTDHWEKSLVELSNFLLGCSFNTAWDAQALPSSSSQAAYSDSVAGGRMARAMVA